MAKPYVFCILYRDHSGKLMYRNIDFDDALICRESPAYDEWENHPQLQNWLTELNQFVGFEFTVDGPLLIVLKGALKHTETGAPIKVSEVLAGAFRGAEFIEQQLAHLICAAWIRSAQDGLMSGARTTFILEDGVNHLPPSFIQT